MFETESMYYDQLARAFAVSGNLPGQALHYAGQRFLETSALFRAGRNAGCAIREHRDHVVGRHVAVNSKRAVCPVDSAGQHFAEVIWSDCRVHHHETQSCGHLRMDHASALRHSRYAYSATTQANFFGSDLYPGIRR